MADKHSRLGIASFILSIVAGGLMFVLFIVAALLAHNHHGDGRYPGQVLVGFAIILLLLADMVAVGLGIAAVFQKDRQKLFGILGLVFSAGTVLGTIALIALGLMFAHSAR